MNLYLLIIEDEQAIIDDWAEKLEFYSAEEEPIYTIVPSYVKELGQAKSLLSNSSFDAAVIDIRLESADGKPNKDGNELFEMITRQLPPCENTRLRRTKFFSGRNFVTFD